MDSQKEPFLTRRNFLIIGGSAAASFMGSKAYLLLKNPQIPISTPAASAPQLETTVEKEAVTIPFKQYASARFQEHDTRILNAVRRWNGEFASIRNFTHLSPRLVKAMALVESGGTPDAWQYDPLQLANQGDTGLDDLRRVDPQHLLPGYPELRHVRHTPRRNGRWAYDAVDEGNRISADESILFGTRYLFQKALKFTPEGKKLVPSFRSWTEAAERYNGHGDPSYLGKVSRLLAEA